MKKVFIIATLFVFMTHAFANSYIKFTNDLLVDKTFYMVEDNGYESIIKFYLNKGKLKIFYVIDYKGKLDETMTLSPTINKEGFIEFTVFDRPTEFRLVEVSDKQFVIKEHHYHSDKYKNILTWHFEKPEHFMAQEWNQ